MNSKAFHVRESDGKESPDVCGTAIDLINAISGGSTNLSLATVFIDPRKSSIAHHHKVTEEIYYFIDGFGRVVVGEQTYSVSPGSAVYVPVNQLHQVINDSNVRLKFLSADSPPFDAKDIYYS